MDTETKRTLVTIAIPVFNEEKNLPALYARLDAALQTVPNCDFEVLFIDNGSADRSGSVCKGFAKHDPRIKYVRFSRNFGIEASFFAGATYASGDALIYLFSDGQDPPESIPIMIEIWKQGNEVVYGVLSRRADGNILKSWGAYFAYRLIFLLSDINIPVNATDFRLLSRPVINTLKRCDERTRYMRGLSHWAGFRQASFEFERAPRKHGKTNAGLWFCIKYALTAMISFSTKPLRMASFVGVAITGLSVFGGIVYIIHTILTRRGIVHITPPPAGWTTIVLLMFFFGGIQCLFLGIMGEYLAQMHKETKFRPIWIVDEQIGLEEVT